MYKGHNKTLINNTDEEAADGPKERSEPPRAKARLVSLDAVRGLTVAVMIFVDTSGGALAGHVQHSPWNDVTFADFVMPFFLFMVGMSIAISFRKYSAGLTKKVLWRTVKLFVIGLFIQGAPLPSAGSFGYNLHTIRVPGILQRIAWAYCIVALMAIYFPKFGETFSRHTTFEQVPFSGAVSKYFRLYRMFILHWIVSLSFLFIYIIIMLELPVSDWSYNYTYSNGTEALITIECNHIKGDLTPRCIAIREIDMWILGYNRLFGGGEFRRMPECSSCSPRSCYKEDAAAWCEGKMDPEGILSSVPTVLTTFIGMHFGNILLHIKDHKERLRHWVPQALFFWLLGVIIHVTCWKMNKQMWSPSYLFMMAGACGLVFCLFYLLMDFRDWQPTALKRTYQIFNQPFHFSDVFQPLVWVGMNAIFIYLMSPSGGIVASLQSYFWWGYSNDEASSNNLLQYSYDHIFCHNPDLNNVCHGGIFKDSNQKWAIVTGNCVRIVFWIIVAGVLHRFKWYWAL